MLSAGETINSNHFGLPPIPQNEFNRIAKRLGMLACWGTDGGNEGIPGAVDPNELVPCRPHQSLDGVVRNNQFTEKFARQYRRIAAAYRQELVKKELAKTTVVTITTNLNDYKLSPAKKRMVADILAAGQALETLYQIQRGALQHKRELATRGTRDDNEFYRRYQTVWCDDRSNPYCTAVPSLPTPSSPLYSEGIKCEDLQGDELTNPFSTLRLDITGKLRAIPFAEDSALKEAQIGAAVKLNRAAQSARQAEEGGIAQYLEEVAKAVLSKKPYPYAKADEAWVVSKDSRFYLRIGADEPNYEDTCHLRATYHMSLGIKDLAAEEAMKKVSEHMQDFERHMAGLIPGYTARAVQLATPEFVNVIMENGASRGQVSGTAAAQTLPNWCGEDGKAECKTRAVQFTNKTSRSYANKALLAQLSQILSKNVMGQLKLGAIADKAVYHEIAHNLGPQMKDYQEKFGDLTLWMEEMKAEIGAEALLPALKKFNLASKDEAKSRFAGLLAWCLGQIKRASHRGEKYHETKSPYQQLAAVIVGYFTEQGAFLFDNKEWDIDWEKAQAAALSLYSEVGRIYLQGNREAAQSFFRRYTSGSGLAHLHLDRINETIAKVPTTLFAYRVTGLSDARRFRRPLAGTGNFVPYHGINFTQ